MKHKTLLLIAGFTLLFTSGCRFSLWPFGHKEITPVKPPAPLQVTPAPGPAEKGATEARESLISKGSASVKAATYAASTLPASNAGETVQGELRVAGQTLPDPTPDDEKQAMARVMLGLNGDLKTYRQQLDAATGDLLSAKTQLAQIEAAAKLERENNAATLNKREAEFNKTYQELKAQVEQAKKELEAERDAISRKVQFWFSMGLRLAAAGLFGLACFKVYGAFTSAGNLLGAVKGASALLFCSAVAFILSWAVAQSWFYYACFGFIGLSCCVLGFGVWREQKMKATLSIITDQIEEGKDPDSDNPLTSTVNLIKLSKSMDSPHKAIIKDLRAEISTAKIKA